MADGVDVGLRLRNSFVFRKRLTSAVAGGADAGRFASFTSEFLFRFTATFLSRFTLAAVVDVARFTWFAATSRRARVVAGVVDAGRLAFLSRLAAAFRLGLTEEFRVAAAPPPPILCDDGIAATGFRLTAEFVRGAAYDRCCRVCADETLRCARAVAGIADAGRAAVAGLAA